MWQDLALNLVSEVIGILLTVFLVDRLIRKREVRQWAPIRELLYSQIVFIISDIYEVVLTDKFRKVPPSSSETTYQFEHAYSYLSVEVDTQKLNTFYDFIQNEAEPNYFTHVLKKLTETKSEINNIVHSSTSLFEPDLLDRLLRLYSRIKGATEYTDTQFEDEDLKLRFGVELLSIIADTYVILGKLRIQARKK